MRIGLLVTIFMASSLLFLTQGTFSKEPHEDLYDFFDESQKNNQVLHRHSQNKSYLLSPEATGFVEKNFRCAIAVSSDSEVIRIGSDYVSIDGEYLVFGVGSGKAVNFLAALNPMQTIYGFDSFNHKKAVTPFLHNVSLIEGQFRQSLPDFSQNTLLSRQVAFLYINCHSYRSTKEVFVRLRDHLADRSVIVFDEFYNFPGFENQEYKAFEEFLVDNQFDVEYLSYNTQNEQVAVRLKKRW